MIAVIFHLKTTEFGPNAEVIQIAAKYHNQEFNVYILSPRGIQTIVSEMTNLSIVEGERISNREDEYRRPTESPKMACILFISFLKNISNDIILAAHNGITFDASQIVKTMNAVGLLEEFGSIVKGFTDTISVLKRSQELASRVKPGNRKSFSLSVLACEYLESDSPRGTHDAIIDIQMLDDLLKKFAINEVELINSAVLFSSVADSNWKEDRKADLSFLEGPISKTMITKIVDAGLTLDQLETTFRVDGENGITSLLSEDINGRRRITKDKKILRNLCDALRTRLDQRNLTTENNA